nr:GNAT family N-acetyltransferase [Nakamurella flavida]
MLTWGSAGQIVTVDGEAVGFALYAPPTAVPGAAAFPTAPVSPDAVLLTAARISPEHTGQGLGRYLMNGVVADLTRRGVRAIEVFGRVEGALPGDEPSGEAPNGGEPGGDERADDIVADLLDAGVPRCLIPAGFAEAVGFVPVAPHPRYPRLRYELRSGSGWKADVESALEKLFTVITVPSTHPVAARERELAGAR